MSWATSVPYSWGAGLKQSRTALYSRENLRTPACESREEARSQVPGRVDSIAGVEAHGQADDQHHEADSEGLQTSRDWVVVWVDYGQDAHDQCSCSNNLTHSAGRTID